jgi:hypothetical protein
MSETQIPTDAEITAAFERELDYKEWLEEIEA